jgi:hypothetical protein
MHSRFNNLYLHTSSISRRKSFLAITHAKQDYILVFLLIALSGFPFFTQEISYLAISSLIAAYFFYNRNKKIHKFFIITILFLLLLVISQTWIFNYFSLRTNAGLFLRWTFPFLVVSLVGKKLPLYYINTIYVFCIISFMFFVPTILFRGFEPFLLTNFAPIFDQGVSNSLHTYTPNIIIYSLHTYGGNQFLTFLRNSGPFWEPGAFAGYTLIALILNVIKNDSLIGKKNIIFYLAILSTLSTAGFVALSFFLLYYNTFIHKNIKNLLVIPFIILAAVLSYYSFEILNLKVDRAITQIKYQDTNTGRSRVVSALLDIEDMKKHPLSGRGRSNYTRFGYHSTTYSEHRNNGVTDFAVKYGIPFWLFYFYFIFRSFKIYSQCNYNKEQFAIIALGVILLIGFAETYFQQSLFIALFYLHIAYHNNSLDASRSNNSHVQ